MHTCAPMRVHQWKRGITRALPARNVAESRASFSTLPTWHYLLNQTRRAASTAVDTCMRATNMRSDPWSRSHFRFCNVETPMLCDSHLRSSAFPRHFVSFWLIHLVLGNWGSVHFVPEQEQFFSHFYGGFWEAAILGDDGNDRIEGCRGKGEEKALFL